MPSDDVVHQLAETKAGYVKTKCGVSGRSDKVRTSAWHSDTTCPVCLT